MRKIVLTYGLIAGGILAVMMFGTFVLFKDQIPFDKGMLVGYTTMVIAFLMIFFGVKTYRDSVGGGSVSFGRAFKIGILITVIASMCYVASWQVVYHKFVPDYIDTYAAKALAQAREDGATEAELAAKTQEMAEFKEMYKDPLVVIGFSFLEPLPVGVVLTLVTAGVLSRKRRDEIEARV